MQVKLGMEQSGRRTKTDHFLIVSVLLLTGIGLVTLYSASYAYAERFRGNSLYFISRQAVLAVFGFALFFIASRANMQLIRTWIFPIVIGTMILCLLTFVPGIGVMRSLGVMRNGAARWIRLGSSTYQPSELVKLVLPFYLAHIFEKKEDKLDSFSAGVLPPTLVKVVFFILIYMQNNFSTAFFILFNALVIFYLAGIKIHYFFAAALIFLPLSVFFVLTREHRLLRILSFLRPEEDPLGMGFQIRASIMTIGSGGFWGKGIGQGTRKIASVPEIHSDFIFASFAEEGGFFSVLLIFILFAVFGFAVYRCALKSTTLFRRLLSFGLGTMIISQILLNVAVVVGALPVTGIPLPFFSAGGSSLVTTLIMCGFLVNNSREVSCV